MGRHIRFDWAIKRLLRDKANFDVLEGFLSELLMQDIIISEILESEANKEDEADKFNRVDILVNNTQGELMLIEVQNERENDYFHRMNYGQAKLITGYIKEGDPYDKIKRVYSINIVYFDLGQGSDYIYVGRTDFRGLHNNDLLQLNASQKKNYPLDKVSDIFTNYYLLKINNFDNIAKTSLDEWIYFLKNSEIKDDFKAKGLPEAKEKLRVDNLSPAEKEIYNNFIKTQRIRDNELKSALTEGYVKAEKQYLPIIEEERKQKEEERKQKEEAKAREEEERRQKEEAMDRIGNMILKMSERGISVEELAEDFKLSVEEINDILTAK